MKPKKTAQKIKQEEKIELPETEKPKTKEELALEEERKQQEVNQQIEELQNTGVYRLASIHQQKKSQDILIELGRALMGKIDVLNKHLEDLVIVSREDPDDLEDDEEPVENTPENPKEMFG